MHALPVGTHCRRGRAARVTSRRMVTDGGPRWDGTSDHRSVDRDGTHSPSNQSCPRGPLSHDVIGVGQPYAVMVMDASPSSPSIDARSLLTRQRDRLSARLAVMELELRAMVEASVDSNADDEHDPEGATIAFERAQLRALTDGARRQLAELDAALARWAAGSYGPCESCGKPIGELRLAARPAARVCLSCAEH